MFNKKIFVLLLLFVVFFCSLSSVSALERTISVNDNISDSIDDINLEGSGDHVLTLNPGVYNKERDSNVRISILENVSITIQGNGSADDVIINSNFNSSFFILEGNIQGSVVNRSIVFKNITFKSGKGGIGNANYIAYGTVSIFDCKFIDIGSDNAIFAYGSGVNISNSIFINCTKPIRTNTAYILNSTFIDSGELFLNGNFPHIVDNCKFINNFPSLSPSSSAIYIENHNETLIPTNITNNLFFGFIKPIRAFYKGFDRWGDPASFTDKLDNYTVLDNNNYSFVNSTISLDNSVASWGESVNVSGFLDLDIEGIIVTVALEDYNITTSSDVDGFWSVVVNAPFCGGSYNVIVENMGHTVNSTIISVPPASANSSVIVNNSSPYVGDSVNVSGVLKNIINDSPIANLVLNISVIGVNYTTITNITTNAEGFFSLVVLVPFVVGEYDIIVSLEENDEYAGFINSTSINIIKTITNSTIIINPSSSIFHNNIDISGYLANYTNIGAVNVTVGGHSYLVDVNDTTGFWSLSYIATHAGLIDVVVALFGNQFYEDFTNSTTFNVIKADTNSTIVIDPLNGFVGDNFVISGYLANYTNIDAVNVTVGGVSELVDVDNETGFWSLSYIATHAGIIDVIVALSGNSFYEDFTNSTDLTLVSPDSEPPIVVGTAGGTYFGNVLVNLNISEKGSIYYTLDGSTPTNKSTLYTGPFTLNKSVNLKYIAIDLVGNPSEIYSANYDINKATTPKIPSVKEGNYKNDVKVSLIGVTGSKIYYKLGNSAYKLYTGPLTIKSSTTLSYYYQDPSGAKSLVKSVKYVIDKTAPKSLEKNIKKYKMVKAKKQTLKIKFSENIKINSKNLKKIIVKTNKGKKIKVNLSVKGKYLLVKVPKIAKKTKYIINIPKNIVSDNIGNLLKSKVALRYLSK